MSNSSFTKKGRIAIFAVTAATMVMTLVAASLMTAAAPAYALHEFYKNQGDCVSSNALIDNEPGNPNKDIKELFRQLCQHKIELPPD